MPVMFDLVDEALHQMALPVQLLVILPHGLAVCRGWNHWDSPATRYQQEESIGIISLVRNHIFSGIVSDQVVPLRDVVALPSRQLETQGITQSIHAYMDFGAEAAPAAAQSLGRLTALFFEAPAAQGWARTMVESMIRFSMSGSQTNC